MTASLAAEGLGVDAAIVHAIGDRPHPHGVVDIAQPHDYVGRQGPREPVGVVLVFGPAGRSGVSIFGTSGKNRRLSAASI